MVGASLAGGDGHDCGCVLGKDTLTEETSEDRRDEGEVVVKTWSPSPSMAIYPPSPVATQEEQAESWTGSRSVRLRKNELS